MYIINYIKSYSSVNYSSPADYILIDNKININTNF